MLTIPPAEEIPSIGAVPPAPDPITDGTIIDGTITLAPGLEIVFIIVGGVIYTWAPSLEDVSPPGGAVIGPGGIIITAPTPGTFWYDWDTGVLTLPDGIPDGTPITVYGPSVTTKTDLISTIPTPLKSARGAVSISYSLFNPPSISSVTFVARRAQKSALLAAFPATGAVNIDGHRYYPTQKSLVESPSADSVAIAVGYESEFRNNPARTPMDKPVRIKPLLPNQSNPSNSYLAYTTAQIAGAAQARALHETCHGGGVLRGAGQQRPLATDVP
jgi:hypothetical protein